jgi:hypothetical protein
MKPHFRHVQQQENSDNASGSAICWWEDCVAEAAAMLLEPIQEPASPDELRCEDAEGDENGQPAWAGREDHHDADAKEREAENNSKPPLGLLNGLDQHLMLISFDAQGARNASEIYEHAECQRRSRLRNIATVLIMGFS